MDLRPGARIGPYEVQAHLGSGGAAEVVRAVDASGRTVALKVLRVATPGLAARLRREATLQQALSHPNIVGVHGVLEVDGVPVVVMEHVHGFALDRLLASHRPTVAQVDALARGILDGVGAAHRAGLVHRDVKPANVLLALRDGEIVPRIADFGLARTRGDDPGLTKSGQLLGTPAYMAPEQIESARDVDHRADLFSVGATLYEALAGVRAFPGDDAIRVWVDIRSGERVPLRAHRPDLPERILRAVEAALVTDPDARVATAEALAGLWLDGAAPSSPDWPAELLAGLARTPERPDGATWDDHALPPHNLPEDLDAFVGRRHELARLRGSLGADRLVTLVGTGGSGKSRLAREAARVVLPDWPGGVWWCDLSEARTAVDACRVVVAALGERLGEGTAPGEVAVLLARRGRALWVLDNFEQLADLARDTVGAWFAGAPDATFLVTSREPLHLAAERVVAVEPLAVPATDDSTGLRGNDAFDLFVARARQVDPRFAVADGATIAGILRRLDGLPLAIELAAARVRVLPPERLLARLSEHLDLLRTPRRDVSDRQATLRAALAWSWQLLQPWERLALAQLSVLQGAFRAEDAEAVLDLSAWPDAHPLDALEALVDKSLVRRVVRAGGEPALALYVSVAAYAAEELARPGAVEVDGVSWTGPERRAAVEGRHVDRFAALVQLTIDDPDRPTQWVADLPNLAVASERALARGDARAAALTGYGVGRALRLLGPIGEACRRLEEVRRAPGCDPDLRRMATYWLGGCLRVAGRLAEASAAYSEVVEDARANGRPRAEATALDGVGSVLHDLGRAEEAMGLFERALAIHRAMGNHRLAGMTLGHVGMTLHYLGRTDEALARYREGVQLLREIRADAVLAYSLANLGHLLQSRLELAEAIGVLEESVALHAADGNQGGRASAMLNLAGALGYAGRLDEAVALLDEVVSTCRRQGDRMTRLYATLSLASITPGASAGDRARRLLAEADELVAVLGSEFAGAVTGYVRAHVALVEGEPDEALGAAVPAVEVGERLGQPALVAEAAVCAARACVALGRADDALGWLARVGPVTGRVRLEVLAATVQARAARGDGALAREVMDALDAAVAPLRLPESSPIAEGVARARRSLAPRPG